MDREFNVVEDAPDEGASQSWRDRGRGFGKVAVPTLAFFALFIIFGAAAGLAVRVFHLVAGG